MPTIILGAKGQYETEVSEEDYEFLVQWRWNFKKNSERRGGAVYARRTLAGGAVIYMASFILEVRMGLLRPSPKHEGDHRDRKSLNNQRYNLKWSTKSEQSKNRLMSHYFGKPVQAPALITEIPF